MRILCVIAVLLASGLMAADKIPAGAREVEPYTYAYTDAAGHQWMYRQTPFGVTKWQPSDVPPPRATPQSNPVTVTDLGDSFRFERRTPFAQNVWTKKKSELSADEKELLKVAGAGSEAETK